MTKAVLIVKDRVELHDGSFVELKVWGVPKSKDKPHGYKYSFVYIVKGSRAIGYDNSEGRGDHRHYGKREEVYEFKGIDRLFEDFYNDIRRMKNDEG